MDGSNVNLYIVLFMIILVESNDETTNISVQVHDPLSTTLPPKRELPTPCGQTAFVGMRCGRSDRKEADEEGGAEDAGRRGYPRFTGYYIIIIIIITHSLGARRSSDIQGSVLNLRRRSSPIYTCLATSVRRGGGYFSSGCAEPSTLTNK